MVGLGKIALFTSIIVLVSLGCGCSRGIVREPRGVREERNTQEIAKENLEKVIAAINDRDSEALKNLFSKNVQDEAELLDEGIDYIFSTLPNGITSVEEDHGAAYEEHVRGNSKEVTLRKNYLLNADGDEYRFMIKSCTRNDREPDEEAVQGILLFPADKEIDFKFNFRGIYIPDSFLEEHYPEKYKEYKEKSAEEEERE